MFATISLYLFAMSFLSGAHAATCEREAKILEDHKQVFPPGTLTPVKAPSLFGYKLVGFRVRQLKAIDVLSRHGFEYGDIIYEVCGVDIEDAFSKGFDVSVCCNAEYPKVLTIKAKRENHGDVTAEVPQREYRTGI
ncbi:hypothetical protein [Corallincola holothuriorum]|nr:hypothetical protein [Corallincola holothuriorum]